MNNLNFIDIFAGAGGLSEGFSRNGLNAIAHIEMKPEACLTLKTRACYYYLKRNNRIGDYYKYLSGEIDRKILYSMVPDSVLDTVINETMCAEGMPALFNRIDTLMAQQGVIHVDLLVGGPPCQAYSLVGRARSADNMVGDPRNYLYKVYCQVLEKYQPEMFVFENVPGLLTANKGAHFADMQNEFKLAGYEIDNSILNASDYSVLQNRHRVILIGWKVGSGHRYPSFEKVKNTFLVQDMLSDLPPLQAGETDNHYATKATNYLKWSEIRSKDDILTWHTTRPNIERDREIYRRVISTWDNQKQRLKYTDLPEELCTHQNRTAFLDRFKVIAADLPASQTMVAHISKDGHYFIHPDIVQARSISVREAARIQSFPDDFYFEGSRTAVYMQIGNAVPPLMAAGIAKAIKKQLKKE